MTQTFRSFPHRYAQNALDGHRLNVRKAILENPHGGEEPGIAIGFSQKVIAVIPHSAAFRIAQDLVNILTEQKEEHRS